jgi:nicotinamidase-related amidase
MESFNPEKTAVVVVDMQNCFANEDGVLYAPPSGEIIKPISDFVETARGAGVEVMYTQDTHTTEQFEEEFEQYDEFDRWGEHAVEGSWGHKIVPKLAPKQDEYVVQKQTYDAFYNTNLNKKLQSKNIETVVFVGTLVNVCVMHSASSAALNDYDSIVVEDLVGYLEQSDKEYALEHIDWLFGRTIESREVQFE